MWMNCKPSTTKLTIFFYPRVVTTSKLTIFFHPRVVTTSKLTIFFHPRVVTTSKLTIFFHPLVVTRGCHHQRQLVAFQRVQIFSGRRFGIFSKNKAYRTQFLVWFSFFILIIISKMKFDSNFIITNENWNQQFCPPKSKYI